MTKDKRLNAVDRWSALGWFRSGEPMIWLTAASVALCVLAVVGLLALLAVRGLGHFWASDVMQIQINNNIRTEMVLGQVAENVTVPRQQLIDAGITPKSNAQLFDRTLLKRGNREHFDSDFVWILDEQIESITRPEDILVIERLEWGNFYGTLVDVRDESSITPHTPETGDFAWQLLGDYIDEVRMLREEIKYIERLEMGKVNKKLDSLRLAIRQSEPDNYSDLARSKAELEEDYQRLQSQLVILRQKQGAYLFSVKQIDGSTKVLPVSKVVRIYRPNSMSYLQKMNLYMEKLWEFLSEQPREANTEGGVFPAIFGTVMMVILMSIIVTPFGVVAAVYMREYATQGSVTRVIRIAVNNLAGVPSIVYGVFGLGFFVYGVGGEVDKLFFAETLPSPTFGTPGLMWASLTLALLTLPVVIVATEEGLARIPKSIREGSLALGATRFETLVRVVLPMASPAMMTGLILAVARAAGEVAPLMLVGVVKLAPNLPVDGTYPYIHLDQKFMHLGFHIYDVGFQSPNVEAARPLVYATALLLVFIITMLNLLAIYLRNRLREKYKLLEA